MSFLFEQQCNLADVHSALAVQIYGYRLALQVFYISLLFEFRVGVSSEHEVDVSCVFDEVDVPLLAPSEM